MIPSLSERALILAPRGRDAAVAADMLHETGIVTVVCRDIPALIARLEEGAGFALVKAWPPAAGCPASGCTPTPPA